MKLNDILTALSRKIFLTNPRATLSSATKEDIQFLLHNKISCDDLKTILEKFEKAVDGGENLLIFMPLIRPHLDSCPDCREMYKNILMSLQPE